MSRSVVIAILLTWVVVSFVPSVSLANFIGKGKGKGGY